MRNLLLITMLVLVSVGSSAKNYSVQEREQNCKRISSIAESAMESRQNGSSILKEIELIEDVYKKTGSKSSYELMRDITLDAYDQPSFLTEEYQKKAVTDFSAKYYVACMASINKSNN